MDVEEISKEANKVRMYNLHDIESDRRLCNDACGHDNNAVPRTCTIDNFFSKCPDKPYS